MKKFQLYLIVALLVVYCAVALASVPADNRRSFNLTQVTIVKIMEDKLTVRDASGKLATYEIAANLRANKFFSLFRIGEKIRIQLQGNRLIHAERLNPQPIQNQNMNMM